MTSGAQLAMQADIQEAVQEAKHLKDGFKLRQPAARSAYRYLCQVVSTLECVRDVDVPIRAGPIVWHILQNFRGANSQLTKFPSVPAQDDMQLGNLTVLFCAAASRTHILITLLAMAMTPEDSASELMESIHQTLFPTRSQETRPSLGKQREQAALRALEAVMGAACQGCNATEVQQHLTEFFLSMLPLDDEAISAVDKASGLTLSPHVSDRVAPAMRQALDFLSTYFLPAGQDAKASLRPVRDQLKEIIVAMAEARSVESASLASAIPVVLQEICQARATSRDPGLWSTSRAGAAAVAERVLGRLASGATRLPACPITGLPYAATPPVDGGGVSHAVQMQACGCCMSKCAADATLKHSACAVCHATLPAGEQYRLSHCMLRVAQAHRARMLLPEAPPEQLTVEAAQFPVPLSARADGAFHPGTVCGAPVAVLQLHLGGVEPAQRASISHALVATNLAATLSPLHIRMRAVVWEPDQVSVAYDREPFQGTPGSALQAAAPLTVDDVIAAGRSGRPAQQALNVILDVAEAHAAADAAAWSDAAAPALGALTPDRLLVRADHRIQVSDFRLLSRSCVPAAVARAVRDSAPPEQTPVAQSPHADRYMPPEALAHSSGAAVDAGAATVFSLGALLHFLVAGRHPATASELEAVSRKAPWAGNTRALTQSITRANLAVNAPPRTDELRARMLDRNPAARPLLAEVTDALRSELYTLSDAGSAAQPATQPAAPGADSAGGPMGSVVPAWDRTRPAPSAPCSVFRLPERSDDITPPTYFPASSQSEFTDIARTVYMRPAHDPPPGVAAGVTSGVTTDILRSPLRHNVSMSQGFTVGSLGSAMSVSGDVRSAAAPGGTTNSSCLAAVEPLQSCNTSCAGSGPMHVNGQQAAAEAAEDPRFGGSSASPFARAASGPAADVTGGGASRPTGGTDLASSAGMGADTASQMSNDSGGRHDPGSPGSKPRRKVGSGRKMPSFLDRGQPSTLPQLVQLVNGDWRGCDCDLQGRQFKMGRSKSGMSRSSSGLRADPSLPPGWDVEIREQDVNFQSPSFDARRIFDLVARDENAAHVGTCCVASEGTVLREGYVDLAVTGRLVFGPGCRDVALCNMTINDGTLICFGDGCSVRLEACALAGCSVIVAGGAHLSISRNCDFRNTRIAIFAHGPGTHVSLESSAVRGCRQALCVTGGASAALTHCVISEPTVTGCEVRGQGSTLELRQCTITDAGSPPDYQWWIQGLWAHSGARAVATRCNVMRMTAGALADGPGTELHLQEASLLSNLACGAYIGYSATATFKDCDFHSIAGSPPQHTGLDVSGDNTHATIIGSRLRYNVSYGTRVSDRATLKASRCQTERNQVAGWSADQGAAADLQSCTSAGERAYMVVPGAHLRAVLCRPDLMD